MTGDTKSSFAVKPGEESVLDEEFLRQVDCVLLARKQLDPYQLEQVSRAAEAETRLANSADVYGLDRRHGRHHEELG